MLIYDHLSIWCSFWVPVVLDAAFLLFFCKPATHHHLHFPTHHENRISHHSCSYNGIILREWEDDDKGWSSSSLSVASFFSPSSPNLKRNSAKGRNKMLTSFTQVPHHLMKVDQHHLQLISYWNRINLAECITFFSSHHNPLTRCLLLFSPSPKHELHFTRFISSNDILHHPLLVIHWGCMIPHQV